MFLVWSRHFTNQEILENDQKYVLGMYGRAPVVFTHGQGAYVFDDEGTKYLDFMAGIAVNSLGHAHPRLVKCAKEQIEKLV